ncbi:hypothetical protein Pfo_028876 [Paulownia fortunei]|nr:hypothetical protein Pfo_028876 [Paulownia fortunei]
MAQQEEGWPLGLQPLNVRVGLVRNRDVNGHFPSILYSLSTGSFFHDKSITLGSLIGISSILELSRRSTRGRIAEPVRNKKNYKTKTWFLSLCSRLSTDASCQQLQKKSKPQCLWTRRFLSRFGPEFIICWRACRSSQSSAWLDSNGERTFSRDLLSHENADGPPLLLSCLCGNLTIDDQNRI